MKHVDTICALASGPPPAALIVLRVSGPAVAEFMAQHLQPNPPNPRRAVLSSLINLQGEIVDEGLAVWMPGPKSYTGDDTLELTLHGGQVILEEALAVMLEFPGIRLAEPGEFTRRAFETGAMDLTQAEAVADLIDAETKGQKEQALRQMSGAFGDVYRGWRGQILDLMVLAESVIDFPDEEDAPKRVEAPMRQKLDELIREFQHTLKDNSIGERVRDGFQIAILGAPNAGKSTLLNRIAKRDAAIVSDIAGTTRDTVEVRLKLAGQLVTLVDTAGLRETTDPIELEGIRRAHRAGKQSDLAIILENGAMLEPQEVLSGQTLHVWNKSDIESPTFAIEPSEPLGSGDRPFVISGKTGDGIDALISHLEQWLKSKTQNIETAIITRARHRDSLTQALEHLTRALARIEEIGVDELVGEDLRLAARDLGCIIGDVGVEDVLGAIFSQFCIGK